MKSFEYIRKAYAQSSKVVPWHDYVCSYKISFKSIDSNKKKVEFFWREKKSGISRPNFSLAEHFLHFVYWRRRKFTKMKKTPKEIILFKLARYGAITSVCVCILHTSIIMMMMMKSTRAKTETMPPRFLFSPVPIYFMISREVSDDFWHHSLSLLSSS